ncbi:MAG: hypothetical protein AB1816_07895 [Bacillota bacterium]
MKYTRKTCLGLVAVDSGHLMVSDPLHLSGSRVFPRRGKGEKAAFWGRDARRMCDVLREQYSAEPEPAEDGAYRVAVAGRTAEDVVALIEDLTGERGLLVVAMPWTGSVLDRTYEACSGRDQGGQLHFADGRPGAGVCFQSGIGDGVYQVWAYYAEIPG